MSDILIIGGGFAGVWSAAAAARAAAGAQLSITLVAPGEDLVIRPRLYEPDPHTLRVALDRTLAPIGVRRERATVTGIDTARREVSLTGSDGRSSTPRYRRLVLAAGSQLRRPTLTGSEHLHDVDTLQGAVRLQTHLRRLAQRPDHPGRFTAVVVGAGFTGLEIATELTTRLRQLTSHASGARPHDARVVLVERADVVGPELGATPRPTILAALAELGIQLRLGRSLTSLSAQEVRLDDGSRMAADTVIWTAGVQASPLTAQIPGTRDHLGRLRVDQHLQVPEVPGVFAAGDTAAVEVEPGHDVLQSCQHAIPLGKYAGHNAVADLLGHPLAPFTTTPYVTCLDLGQAGAIFTTGFERTIALSGAAGKHRKQLINRQWIYPPIDDPVEILRAADYQISTRDAATVH